MLGVNSWMVYPFTFTAWKSRTTLCCWCLRMGQIGGLVWKKKQWVKQNGCMVKKQFKYPKVVSNHYQYRHAVDNNNAKQHSPISIEQTWATSCWPNRVFAFLLDVTGVNCMLAAVLCGYKHSSMLDFWRLLAKELINNNYKEKANKKRGNWQERALQWFMSWCAHRAFKNSRATKRSQLWRHINSSSAPDATNK